MPLRKLWNSIRGKSSAPTTVAAPPKQSDARSATASQRPQSVTTTADTIRGAASRDDKKLFRRIESMSIQSILEIGVGDGLRSLAMLQTLTHKGHSTPLHYIAIDEFELGGNSLSLRDFHKQLREYPAKAHLVPMNIDAGLDRVVRTYGQVDLVIWTIDQVPTAKQQDALARLCKATTIVISQENGRWSETLASVITKKRAA